MIKQTNISKLNHRLQDPKVNLLLIQQNQQHLRGVSQEQNPKPNPKQLPAQFTTQNQQYVHPIVTRQRRKQRKQVRNKVEALLLFPHHHCHRHRNRQLHYHCCHVIGHLPPLLTFRYHIHQPWFLSLLLILLLLQVHPHLPSLWCHILLLLSNKRKKRLKLFLIEENVFVLPKSWSVSLLHLLCLETIVYLGTNK